MRYTMLTTKIPSTYFCVIDRSNPDNPQVIHSECISSEYSEVTMSIPAHLLSESELIEWGKTVWGDKVYSHVSGYMASYFAGQNVTFNDEARWMPTFEKVYSTIVEAEQEISIPIQK